MTAVRTPVDDQGRPIFSISQFRVYGAANLTLDQHEQPRGCPQQYRRRYVDKDVPGQERSVWAAMGSTVHAALHHMESHDTGPEEALAVVWDPQLPAEKFEELKNMLLSYLDRGGPMNRYATLDHELDLIVQLYEDDDFGPVMFRVIIDWIGLDVQDQELLHIVDYKSGFELPTRESVRRSVQLKGYDWVIRRPEIWDRWMPHRSPRTVVHLDALRWKDIAVRFTAEELEDWHTWAVAVARQMLRDKTWEPFLNAGCGVCPVNHDCQVWQALPGTASTVAMRRTGDTADQLYARLKELQQVAKPLSDAVKDATERLEKLVLAEGDLEFDDGGTWAKGTSWGNETDWPELHELIGPRVWDAAGDGSKAAVDRATSGLDESTRSRARALVKRVPTGTAVKKAKG